VTAPFKDSPAIAAPTPGRGKAAPGDSPSPAAAAPGAVLSSPVGTWGPLDRAGGGDHTSSPLALDPATGRPLPGAEGGLEGSPPALARALAAVDGSCGGQGTASPPAQGGWGGEGRSGPGGTIPVAGPALEQSSPPAPQGRAGGAQDPVPGDRPGFPGSGARPAGAARASAAAPAAGLSGQAWRDAVRNAESKQAAARRNRRGTRAAPRSRSRSGMARLRPAGEAFDRGPLPPLRLRAPEPPEDAA
jgi:hypothetical protein